MNYLGNWTGWLLHSQPCWQPDNCAGGQPALGPAAAGKPALPVLQPDRAQGTIHLFLFEILKTVNF